MTRPAETPDRQKQSRIDDACDVVGHPADHQFATNGRCLRNVVMYELSPPEMSNPAPHQAPVWSRKSKQARCKNRPQIQYSRGTDADQHRTNDEFQSFRHQSLLLVAVRSTHSGGSPFAVRPRTGRCYAILWWNRSCLSGVCGKGTVEVCDEDSLVRCGTRVACRARRGGKEAASQGLRIFRSASNRLHPVRLHAGSPRMPKGSGPHVGRGSQRLRCDRMQWRGLHPVRAPLKKGRQWVIA